MFPASGDFGVGIWSNVVIEAIMTLGSPVAILLTGSAFAAHKHRDQRRKRADVVANEVGIVDRTISRAQRTGKARC